MGTRPLACLPLGLAAWLIASAAIAQNASDPQAATVPLQYPTMPSTPGMAPAKADWRAANRAVAEAAQGSHGTHGTHSTHGEMPGMDHGAHGAGQAVPAPAAQDHAGHASPAANPPVSPAPGHTHMQHGPKPAAASSAVHDHQQGKTSGEPAIPPGNVQPLHEHAQPHQHGGQP